MFILRTRDKQILKLIQHSEESTPRSIYRPSLLNYSIVFSLSIDSLTLSINSINFIYDGDSNWLRSHLSVEVLEYIFICSIYPLTLRISGFGFNIFFFIVASSTQELSILHRRSLPTASSQLISPFSANFV